MLRQFVAGSAVASVAIAVGTVAVLLIPAVKVSPLTTMWCFVPLVWGLWAMCAPSGWVPQRLPVWGAILGLVAGLLAAFVLNVPLRVVGVALPVGMRVLAVVVAVAFYYMLWMLVRVVYRSIAAEPSRAKAARAAGAK
jgi:hypothetical protein